ncbi:hypothetical protein QUA56_07125 [Microcoleus sp. N3A4]|uniref:hypothetical protein n=1 Tax=Microcoleus sp. N3A4 TaxID=3055379 RepID=UPI002FD603CB
MIAIIKIAILKERSPFCKHKLAIALYSFFSTKADRPFTLSQKVRSHFISFSQRADDRTTQSSQTAF